MVLTLIGSARFEKEFKEWNRKLSLSGHCVFSLAVYPSDAGGKDWYTEEEKRILDRVHRNKISLSDGVVLVGDGYVGDSTFSEILHARGCLKTIYLTDSVQWTALSEKKIGAALYGRATDLL